MSKKIIFFLPLANEPRFAKRLSAFQEYGYKVSAFSFERTYYPGKDLNYQYISLGKIAHGKYLSRIFKMIIAIWIIWRNKNNLSANYFYVFGLDIAVMVLAVRRLLGLPVPVLYEVADIRAVMLDAGIRGRFLRWVERQVVKRAFKLVVTSPAFRDEYFGEWQSVPGSKIYVLENKLYPPVPTPKSCDLCDREKHLVIGYFGVLRCQKSWDTLVRLAGEYPDDVQIYIRGYNFNLKNFEEEVAKHSNIFYGGTYTSPDELADMYFQIDICWLVHVAGHPLDAKWSLANRLYEAIYYQVPVIVQSGSQMCKEVKNINCGWCVDVYNFETVRELITEMKTDELQEVREMCRKVPQHRLVSTDDHVQLIQQLE